MWRLLRRREVLCRARRRGLADEAAAAGERVEQQHSPYRVVRGSMEPFSLHHPSKGGVVLPDLDVPLVDRIKRLPAFCRQQARLLGEEVATEWKRDRLGALHDNYNLKHDSLRVDFDMKQPGTMQRFVVAADSTWAHGFSSGQLTRTQQDTVLFSGHLDTRVPKTGEVKRAGWVNMRSKPLARLFRTRRFDWHLFSHFVIRCRGDGRQYTLNLETPGQLDVSWGEMYSYPLFTHGGPYWQLTRVPFSKFIRNVHGRSQDRQWPLMDALYLVESVGITVWDRIAAPFRLEIDWIGVALDRTHFEFTAYEHHQLEQFVV